MSTTFRTSLLTTEERSKSNQLCSLCNSTGHFACIDHCQAVLCAQCTNKHHIIVIQQMREHLERLKMYQMNSTSYSNVSDIRFIQVSDDLEQNADNPIDSNLTVITNKSLPNYLNILDEHIKNDRLLDAKTLADLDMHLGNRTILVTRNSRSPTVSHNSDANKLLPRRSRVRAQTAKATWSRAITVGLNIQKHFQIPIQPSFSMGQHPIAVSLIDRYLETFFCQWRDNSVVLLSSSSIDVYNRGSGLTWSIPLSRILGNVKDKILVGAWCSYTQRLILVGRCHFYMFDIDREKVRCVCKCGCGARCGNGTMPPRARRSITLRFRCQPTYDDCTNSQRFLACSHNGYLFYAYRSGTGTYRLEVHTLTLTSDNADQEQGKQSFASDLYRRLNDKEIMSTSALSINGQLAAICVTRDRLAFVYRRFRQIEKSATKSRNSFEIDHYFALFDHSLRKMTDDVLLSSSIRWVTAIISRGIQSEYLLCDPRGQQLLLYQAIDGELIRRFHIGPVNACCLSDGRLVLWIQKAYASSPIGKLHFISAPYLENYSTVATSFELLKKSHN